MIVVVGSDRELVLRRRAKPTRYTQDVRDLIPRMAEIMRATGGVGLAAPQIGVGLRILVADWNGQLITLVNPKVLVLTGQNEGVEGCLSIPGAKYRKVRADKIAVRGLNWRGKGVVIHAEGFLARVLQHEIDHLDGRLISDRERGIVA